MEYVSTVALTAVFTILLLAAYKLLINPQIVVTINTSKMSKCPDSWTYDGSVCRPNGKSSCMPFDPDASTIQTAAARCNLARTCGTTWDGMCG
jgi:hypothetical protein